VIGRLTDRKVVAAIDIGQRPLRRRRCGGAIGAISADRTRARAGVDTGRPRGTPVGAGGHLRRASEGHRNEFQLNHDDTTFESGKRLSNGIHEPFPVLYLNLDALVYPNVRLNAGGTWELNAQTLRTDGSGVDSTISRSRPFILLRSTNTLFAPASAIPGERNAREHRDSRT